MSELTIPGGSDKGKPLSEASERTLTYWAEKAGQESIRNACAAELARRGVAPPERSSAPRQQERRMARRETSLVEGAFGDSRSATEALKKAASDYHLVSPATVCGNLPEGCELAISLVHIDPDDKSLYPLSGGKLGLDRVALAKIAQASGVTMTQSRRTDDASHPHYCSWLVEIAYRQFDGTMVRRSGSVEIDVREPNGPAYIEICEKAQKANPPRDPAPQLLELRKFLLRHAETKAFNRAVAAMGIKRSYTKDELQKPFAVARVMFTGRSADPEARRVFQSAIAQSFLGGTAQLYGAPGPQTHALPPTPASGMLAEGRAFGDEEFGDAP